MYGHGQRGGDRAADTWVVAHGMRESALQAVMRPIPS